MLLKRKLRLRVRQPGKEHAVLTFCWLESHSELKIHLLPCLPTGPCLSRVSPLAPGTSLPCGCGSQSVSCWTRAELLKPFPIPLGSVFVPLDLQTGPKNKVEEEPNQITRGKLSPGPHIALGDQHGDPLKVIGKPSIEIETEVTLLASRGPGIKPWPIWAQRPRSFQHATEAA